jgi:hypothetical protein
VSIHFFCIMAKHFTLSLECRLTHEESADTNPKWPGQARVRSTRSRTANPAICPPYVSARRISFRLLSGYLEPASGDARLHTLVHHVHGPGWLPGSDEDFHGSFQLYKGTHWTETIFDFQNRFIATTLLTAQVVWTSIPPVSVSNAIISNIILSGMQHFRHSSFQV